MAGMPYEYHRWEIVKETGWSLEYIDALSLGDYFERFQVQDGISKARNSKLVKMKKGK